MNVAVMFSRSMVATAKYISAASYPIIGIKGDRSTHTFINDQGRQILFNDGHRREAAFFNMFAGQLDYGAVWIDRGLKSTAHYYDPGTGAGMWIWPSAAEKCSEFFTRALSLWQAKKHSRAMFFLGASAHLVQDLCVPHHAACRVFGGHVDFEDWAEKRRGDYRVDSGGIYGISDKPDQWIAENARLAKDCYPLVEDHSPEGYHRATKAMLPRAQKTTAGFLLQFFKQL